MGETTGPHVGERVYNIKLWREGKQPNGVIVRTFGDTVVVKYGNGDMGLTDKEQFFNWHPDKEDGLWELYADDEYNIDNIVDHLWKERL